MITNLAAALEELTEAPAPPSTIDASRARKVGRRRMRRRRVFVITGVATLVLAAALAPTALAERNAELQRSGAQPPTGQTPSGPSSPTDRGRSPLIAKARFGWLPQSIVGVGYTAGGHGITTVARGARSHPSVNSPHIWLTVHPGGAEPPLGTFAQGSQQIRVPAPPVNGRDAYWVTANASDPTNGGDIYLRWQAAGNRWAEIHAYYLVDADVEGVVHRIAAGVSVGDSAVPLPLYVTGLPIDFRLADAVLNRPELSGLGPWDLVLSYSVNGAPVNIGVHPTGTRPQEADESCSSANGLDLCIRAPVVPPALDAIGGVDGLRSRITLLGTDERNWTTDVLR